MRPFLLIKDKLISPTITTGNISIEMPPIHQKKQNTKNIILSKELPTSQTNSPLKYRHPTLNFQLKVAYLTVVNLPKDSK
jgi:hypothetical protein